MKIHLFSVPGGAFKRLSRFLLMMAIPVLVTVQGARAQDGASAVTESDVVAAATQQAQIHSIEVLRQDNSFVLNARVDLPLSHELRVAAEHGVPLYFTVEFQVVKPRWWWFDEPMYRKEQTWRVAYNALVRQWLVTSGDYSVPEMSLADALRTITRIYGWPVGPFVGLDPDRLYEAQFRMKLDTSLLPRPFRMDAFGGRAWALSTPWKNFAFQISALAPNL